MRPIVGIDPAFRISGFGMAILDESREARTKIFRSFLDFLFWIESKDVPSGALWVVENSNMQDMTFARYKRGPTSVQLSSSRDVGKNMAISQCVVDLLVFRMGSANVLPISPMQKGRKWGWTKSPKTGKMYQDLKLARQYAEAVMKSEGISRIEKNAMTGDEIDALQLACIGLAAQKRRLKL